MLLLSLPLCAAAQNLFDASHTRQYANYLYQAGEFSLAAEEFERLNYLQPQNTATQLSLVRAYRKAGNHNVALSRLQRFAPTDSGLGSNFAAEKARLLILLRQLEQSRSFLAKNTSLAPMDRLELQVTTELLDARWNAAQTLLQPVAAQDQTPSLRALGSLTEQALTMRRKSPAVSVGLSAVVPGLGKAYSGAWKDGLVSLVFVGLTAWQGYRGFNKNGTQSIYGWTFASLSFGFYIGNLYGSAKAARKFNRGQVQRIQHDVEAQFNTML